MSETVGFRIKIDGADELTNVELRLGEINKQLRDARKEQNKPVYGKLRREQIALQETAKGLRKDIRQQAKDWNDIKKNIPTDSLIGLSKRYRELTNEINRMSKAQRDSDFGKNVIREAREVKSELDKVQQSMGNFRGNVGNYRSALGGGIDGLLGGGIGGVIGGAVAGAATGTIISQGALFAATALKNVLVDATNVVLDYDEANANLNAILGKTADQTEALRNQQVELGASTAFTSAQVAELQTELAKLGFTEEEILASAEGITQFAIATQADVAKAAELVGATLRSFNLEADQSRRVVEVLAAAANQSSLDFGSLETALPIVGGVAAQFGKTVEEVAAQLGVLSDRGIDASTAGTALRNIYLKSAKAGLTFEQALDKVASSQNMAVTALEMFGTRGALQAVILADNAAEVQNLTGELGDLEGVLDNMARTQLESVRGKILLLRSAWEGLILSVEDGSGVLGEMSKNTIDGLTNITTVIRRLNEGTISWGTAFKALMVDVKDASKILDDLTKAEKELADQRREGYEGWMAAMGDIFPNLNKTLDENENKTREWQRQIDEAALNTINGLNEKIKELKDSFNSASIGSEDFNRTSKELTELQERLEKATGKVKKNLKETYDSDSIAGMEASMRELNKQIEKATDQTLIEQLIVQSVELGDKIKYAKDQLFGLRDTAMGGALADILEAEIEKEANAEREKNRRDTKKFWEEADKRDADKVQQELDDMKFLDELEKQSDREVYAELNKLQKQSEANEIKSLQKQFEEEKKLDQRIEEEKRRNRLETLNIISQAGFDIFYQSQQQQLDSELSALRESYQARIDAAEGNKEQQERLSEELAAKEEKLQRDAFERNKRMQIAEALIKGALAALQALANTTLPFPASLSALFPIGAQTAANVAVIASQSYADGGFTGYKGIKDLNLPGRKIVGYVHDREYVAPTSQIEKYPGLFKALEQDRRGFADGGYTTPMDYERMVTGIQMGRMANQGVNSPEYNEMIRQAVYDGAMQGARIGAMEGSKAGTKEGSSEGSREGVIQASRETEFTKIRSERANKNLKQ